MLLGRGLIGTRLDKMNQLQAGIHKSVHSNDDYHRDPESSYNVSTDNARVSHVFLL